MDGVNATALSLAADPRDGTARPRAEFRLLGRLEVGDQIEAPSARGTEAAGAACVPPAPRRRGGHHRAAGGCRLGDEPPPTASAIVYGYVRKLRSALEATSATLSTGSSGYVLSVQGGSLDVAQFERLSGLGRQALRAGDASDARRLLGSALSLWRGKALDGLDGDGFIRAEQLRLGSLRLATTLARVDADLRLGGAADVVDELGALAREHPLDEGIRGQLMVALYRTGNQAEALATYQEIRRELAGELGLDPSRSLQELEGAILRQDPSLDLAEPSVNARPAAVALRTVPPALRLVEAGDACPFIGLATFGVADAEVFFGRERLVSEMVARLADHDFLGVVGPSGSGKSSAVRAGLVPALVAGAIPGTAWIPVIFRPGTQPIRELDRVVFAALDEDQRSRLPDRLDTLGAAASVLPDGSRLCVIVDQFEELFTSVEDPAVRSAFLDALTGAATTGTAAVVVALRADFYGRCAEDAGLAGLLADSQVLVGPMGREEFRATIEGPAARAGVSVEPALVERLLDEADGRPGGLPLLSTALVELWERRDRRVIPLSAFAATGGISGAVGRLAENAFGQLTDMEQATARIVFLRLASGEGEATARKRVQISEFDADTNAEMQRTLSVLAAARLLTVDRGTVEVAHEALFREWPRLQAWLLENADGRRVRAHLTDAARDWDDSGRTPSELYRGARLAAVLDWSADHGAEVNELERQFVAESQAAAQAEARRQRRTNRRLRLLLVGATIGLLVAVVAGAVAIAQRSDALRANAVADEQRAVADQARAAADAQAAIAEQAANSADAQRLGASGLASKQLDLALLLARQGDAIEDSTTTQADMLGVLLRSPAAMSISRPLPGRPQSMAVSPDGTLLAVVNNDGQGAVIDAATDNVLHVHTLSSEFNWFRLAQLSGFRFADNNDLIEELGGPELLVLDPRSGAFIRTITYPDGGGGYSWAPDLGTIGRESVDGRSMTIYDGTTRTALRSFQVPADMTLMDMTMFDGGMVLGALTSGADSDVQAAWDTPGELSYGVWEPGRSLPRWISNVSILAGRGFVWHGSALSPDHATLLLPNTPDFGQGTLLNLHDGTTVRLQDQHSGTIQGGAFSPDGTLVATSGDDGMSRIWDARTGALVDTFAGHDGRVFAPAFSSAGGELTLHTASLDGTTMTWDVSGHGRRLEQSFHTGVGFDSGSTGLAPRIAVSPDGRLLAANDLAGITILDATTHAVVRRIPAHQPAGSFNVVWSPDGTRLAVTGAGKAMVNLYDTSTWQAVGPTGGSLDGPLAERAATGAEIDYSNPGETGQRTNIARAVAFSPDSRELVAGTDDGGVWTWDSTSGIGSGQSLQVGGPVDGLAFNPVSSALAVAYASPSGGLASVYADGTQTLQFTVNVDDDYGAPGPVAFSPDGTVLATGGGKGDVRFWDAVTGAEIGPRVVTAAGYVVDLAWTPSGTTLVSAGSDGTVRLIDVATKIATDVLPGPQNLWVDARHRPTARACTSPTSTGRHSTGRSIRSHGRRMRARWPAEASRRSEWTQYLPNRPYAPACTP